MIRRHRLFFLALLGLGGLSTWTFGASDAVVAVLSSDLSPYKEALQGFQEAYGKIVPVYILSEGAPPIPSETRLIVAIGGKAATYHYPPQTTLLYLMAPGTLVSADERNTPAIKVYMTPSASIVLHKLKEIQPTLKRLGILGISKSRDSFNSELQETGQELGIQIVIDKLGAPNDLPDHLRSLKSKIDALWVSPDPLLLTPESFNTMKEFCRSNSIPFYVPTSQLVELGATGAVTSSFSDIGHSAGKIAKEFLAGTYKAEKAYPEKFETVLNVTSAKTAGLPLEAQKVADKVIP